MSGNNSLLFYLTPNTESCFVIRLVEAATLLLIIRNNFMGRKLLGM